MKIRLLIFTFLLFIQPVFSLDVVYPKAQQIEINSPTTFFIGSTDPEKLLFINDEQVKIHPSGGFAKFVELNPGINTFKLNSGDKDLIFNITRPDPGLNKPTENKLTIYESPKTLKVILNKAPLRSTPVDSGYNRLSHLPENMILVADGENKDFYRILLGKNYFGWISKEFVAPQEADISPAKIEYFSCKVDEEFYTCRFNLSKRVPWAVTEGETLDIKLFNVSDSEDNTFVFKFPLKKLMNNKNLIGYSAGYENQDFVLKVRTPFISLGDKPLSGIRITIDPGHGGTESGAISCLGYLEKDFNLQYAKDLKSALEDRGAIVKLTRKHDKQVSLRERVEMTNEFNSAIFISLHGNALPDTLNPETTHGTEIYYFYPQALPLAKSIMNTLKKDEAFTDHGIIQKSFAVVRNTEALSLLIEIGYLINPEDNYKIMDKEFRKNFTESIADGIEKYITSQQD